MSYFNFQRMSYAEFKMLPKMEQQLYVNENVIGAINKRFGNNRKGQLMIDYAKNGICKGV